jgi:hypothetical protein
MKYVACCLTLALLGGCVSLRSQTPRVVHSKGNPILTDGQYYSADPAPLVVGDTLYILAGRDEAPADVNDFVMQEWQLLSTKNVASGTWMHYPSTLRPETVFSWAEPGHAYAGQIVVGRDSRFYLYAPVQQAHSSNQDPFAIGVAVADSPLGPWKDAHPSGPIVSQSIPEPNTIQNIDPTVMVDQDGRIFLYWGTFGKLRGMELEQDMVTPKGEEISVTALKGFFEAPWLFRRGETYYMLYAANNAGPDSNCTRAIYHACIAYGTATNPLGPWTYRGVILDPVSSTTSHPGAIVFQGNWYLVYHTADAKDGGHFRRSVAIDEMLWDDSSNPAGIVKVKPTHAAGPPPAPTRNIAPAAEAHASNEPIPVQYALAALNDGIVRKNPLPPDMWASWSQHNPPTQWIEYDWAHPVQLNGSRIVFWNDQPAGSKAGVAPPASWHLEYWTGNQWRPVENATAYGTKAEGVNEVGFRTITTRCLRGIFHASGLDGAYAAIAVQEWEALTPHAALPQKQVSASPGSVSRCSKE